MKTVRPWTLCLCLCQCPVAPVASQPPGGGVVTLPVDGTQDLTDAGHAFIEITAPRNTYFVQEAIRLRLRLGVEQQFLETQMVQLFPRRLDVPVQVQAPWVEDLPEADGEDAEKAVDREKQSFALSDDVVAAAVQDRTIAGRHFRVLEIEKSFFPERPGPLVVPTPILRFAYATRFQDDLVQGRMPEDRRDALVRGKQLALEVLPLPTRGRSSEFTGAVGRFSVSAVARPRETRLGESFKLVLSIVGNGNLESFAPPRLDHLKGFHVLGRVDRKDRGRRTVTYDVAPLSLAQKQVPAIRFEFFDPGPPPGYRTAETSPLPLVVQPSPKGALPRLLSGDRSESAVPGVNDIYDIKRGIRPGATHPETPPDPSAAMSWTLVLSPWALALAWLWWRRAPRQNKLDRMAVRKAADVFRRGTDVPEAFTGFLAALLNCSQAAVTAPDLKDQLEARGLPAELAAKAAALRETLVAPRYGGSVSAGGEDAARALVDRVEALFQ